MSDLERLESIKAGILGAIAFTFSYLIGEGIRSILLMNWGNEANLWLKLAIALLSGALFGITYRYIIRGEDNSHLKEGAVLAFGLVRGCVPLELKPSLLDNLGELSLILGENIFYFLFTRLILDWAFNQGWIIHK